MEISKKSFVLYNDLIYTIEHLTNEEKGILFQHLLNYVNGIKTELEDRLLLVVWKPIERQLNRDLEKYEGIVKNRSVVGREGNLKRWNKDLYSQYKKEKITLEEAEDIAKGRNPSQRFLVTDTDTDTDTDIDIDINNNIKKEKSFLGDKNLKTSIEEFETQWRDVVVQWNKVMQHKTTLPEKVVFDLSNRDINNFNKIAIDYTKEEIKEALIGMFSQKDIYKTLLLTPSFILIKKNFMKYLSAYRNDEKEIHNKNKKDRRNDY
ncbi:MAG: hypothetical protein HOB16_07310 [Flavobacteriaceae bacterium]|nr:hypothetical protein [Flavobacteriaceae bacterium]